MHVWRSFVSCLFTRQCELNNINSDDDEVWWSSSDDALFCSRMHVYAYQSIGVLSAILPRYLCMNTQNLRNSIKTLVCRMLDCVRKQRAINWWSSHSIIIITLPIYYLFNSNCLLFVGWQVIISERHFSRLSNQHRRRHSLLAISIKLLPLLLCVIYALAVVTFITAPIII